MHTKRFDAATSLWVWYGNETRTYLKLNRKADEGGWKMKHGENWQPSLKPHELTMLTARKTRLYVLPSRKGAVCIEKGGNTILNLLLQYKDTSETAPVRPAAKWIFPMRCSVFQLPIRHRELGCFIWGFRGVNNETKSPGWGLFYLALCG